MNIIRKVIYKTTKLTQQTAVYILKLNDGRHYCGITNCIERRFKQHVKGKSKFTKKYLPVKLVWLAWCPSRKDAYNIEQMIKHRGVTRWLKHYGNLHPDVKDAQCQQDVVNK